jgi:hypothetical protein
MSEAKYPGSAPVIDPNIAEMAQAVAIDPTSDSLRERIWAAVSDSAETKHNGFRFALPVRPQWALGGLVAASIAVGLALWALPGSPGRPTPAFAKVEKVMADFKTVTWQETIYVPNDIQDNRPQREGFVRTIWARLDSPAYAVVNKWHRTVSFANETYQVRGQGSNLAYSRLSWGIPAFSSLGATQDQSPEARIRAIVLFPKPPTSGDDLWVGEGVYDKNHSPYRRSPWTSEVTTLNGKKAIRFDSVVTYHYQDSRISRASATPKSQTVYHKDYWSYWVEPITYRIVKREGRLEWHTENKSGVGRVISTDFRYDVPTPPGLLEIVPSVGTRFSFVPLAHREARPEEKTEIEQLLRRAMDAWNRGDTGTYAECWDFDHIQGDETAKQFVANREMELMRTRKPFKEWRILGVSNAQTRISGVFTRKSSEEPFPPKESNEFLAVTTAQVTAADGRNRTIPFFVNVRRGEDGFRIIRNFVDNAGRFTLRSEAKPSGTPIRPAGHR